jgi:hypothetical protein
MKVSLVAGLLFFNACAYKMGSPDRSLPGGYRQIFIPIFKNRSMEPGIEVSFTNSLIKEFERSKIGRLVDSSEAEILVEGVIDRVEISRSGTPLSSDVQQKDNKLPTGTVISTAYKIIIEAQITLKKSSDKSVLWTGQFVGERTYTPPLIETAVVNSVNPIYNQAARRQNIDLKATEMMAEAHDRMTENF